jgi:M6 family metalloprotease-like protein
MTFHKAARALAALGATLLVSAAAPGLAAADPSDFGYGDLAVRGVPAVGERPLLTILVDYRDAHFDPGHDARFYRDLLFDGSANLAASGGYFDENSSHRFHFADAGVIGPVRHPDDFSTPVDESTYACAYGIGAGCSGSDVTIRTKAIQRADAVVDFARFDRDGDNQVTADELVVLVISADTAALARSAATRSLCAPTRDSRVPGGTPISVCGAVPGIGQAVGAMTIAHELTHVLQGGRPWEAYGAGARLNTYFSLMAATIFPERDERRSFHLDAYTKMRLGWLRPQVLTTDTSGCFELAAADRATAPIAGLGKRLLERAYVIYDPSRGTREFFLLEHRWPTDGTFDGDPWSSPVWSGLPDAGLGIWRATVDDAGNLLSVPAYDVAGIDTALFLVPPGSRPDTIGPLGRPAGNLGLWSKGDGTARPTWLDGSPSGVTMRVASESVRQRTITVSLRGADCSGAELPAALDPAPPLPPTGPRLLHPCLTDDGLRELRCRWFTGFHQLERIAPVLAKPGRPYVVTWRITPRRRTGPLVITERLPFATAKLRVGQPRPGRTITLRRVLRVPPTAKAGGFTIRASLTAGGRHERLPGATVRIAQSTAQP